MFELNIIFQVIFGLLISYVILFLLSIFLKDNSIADVFWGLGFLQVTIHSYILSGSLFLSQAFLLGLILVWSFRISSHIFLRKIRSKKEDPRYQKYRETWKYFYLRSFFQVYIFQGFLLLIIAIPIFLVNQQPYVPLLPEILIGSLISLFGLSFESIADMQLKNFLKARKGKEIMKTGLWKYSRHPNYFGESVFWLGISIIAFRISPLSILGWLMITFLLRFVSGVPMAEERYKDNKEYIEYQKKTPPMFPNFFIR